MNFLVVGSGAREHIIAEKLDIVGVKIFSVLTNMNPGLLNISKKYIFVRNYKLSMKAIVAFALDNSIDCVVIGPEDPLALGLSDLFWKNDIPVVGPLKILAQIETSKGFTRDLLNKYNIDVSPNYKRFNSLNGVRDFMEYLSGDYVVKFDGLMGGKGVKVSGEHLADINAGLKYCKSIINNSGNFVIEEKLFGEEFSLMSFCDGQNLAHMPAIQDHKRAYEGDTGPNTGGMGCYSDSDHSLPFLKDQEIFEAREINEKVSKALFEHTGKSYKGILYGGFMVTHNGVKLIEYNARFGDPEAMNLLTLLDSDFASVCKYVVPKGYGSNPSVDATLEVNESYRNHSNLYYAAVNRDENDIISTTSSRAAAIVSSGKTISDAEEKCEKGLEYISGNNLFTRHDIAKPDLIQKRITNMENIR